MPPQTPQYSYEAGSDVSILFQQNLNHWNQDNPGYLDVSISYNPSSDNPHDFVVLEKIIDWPAHDQVTQTNFSRVITLPPTASDHAVLRYRYVSNNVGEIYPKNNTQAVFWNCVDIKITEQKKKNRELKKEEEKKVKKEDKGCCTPNQWQIKGLEKYINGDITQHTIYWNQDTNLTRWDRVSSAASLFIWNNYTSGAEYLFDPIHNTCLLYGSDPIYPWCFGEKAYMTYNNTVSFPNQPKTDIWLMENGFVFGSTVDNCYPAFVKQDESSIEFFGGSDITDPSVFNIPEVCLKQSVVTGCKMDYKLKI